MKLYLAYAYTHDTQEILGIFSTEEKANLVLARAKQLNLAMGANYYGYAFDDYNLDEANY